MTKHFVPSRRDMLKGGGALVVGFSLASRIDAGARARCAPRASRSRSPRSIRSSPSTPRALHGLFRQGRSRHRHRHGAPADRRRRARPAARAGQARHRRHGAHARPGQDLGAASPSRSAACSFATPPRPRGRRCSRRPPSGSASKPEELKVADGVISGGGKRVELRRADRRQGVRAQARPRQAGEAQGPEGPQARRQAGPARRHSRTR